MKLKFLFVPLLFLGVLGFAKNAWASVTLPWSTTFNCVDWVQNNPLNCDGMQLGGNWTTANGSREMITADANRPGSTGKGMRFFVGDGVNNNTGGIDVFFATPQKELYFSWWMRYEAGFQWATSSPYLHYDKWLYLHTGTGGTQAIVTLHDNAAIRITNQSSTGPYPDNKHFGWPNIYGVVSDGSWFKVAVYLKMDTDTTNGIGKLWINNVLIAENDAVNFSGNIPIALLGWEEFGFKSNQSSPANWRDMYVDFDDYYVGTTPPASGGSDTIPPAAPTGVAVQ